jgi:hypothetical protein
MLDYQKANLSPYSQEHGNNQQNNKINHNNRYSRPNRHVHHRSEHNNKWKKPSSGKIRLTAMQT